MLRRVGKFCLGASAVTTATYWALSTPPLESLPGPLFSLRVGMQGCVKASRCAWVGAQAYYEYNVWLPSTAQTQEDWNRCHEVTAERLVAMAERNTGLFVKSMQAMAAGSDVLPPIYCKVLRRLQTHVNPPPFGETEKMLQREFQCDDPLSEHFVSFDSEKPIGCASVATAYRAVMKTEDGHETPVAVKVQKLSIREAFSLDLASILLAFKACGMIWPAFDWSIFVNQCKEVLHKELDLEMEADHMRRIGADLERFFPGGEVTTPKIYRAGQGVLITELITTPVGTIHASEVDKINALKLDKHAIARNLSDCFAMQLFGPADLASADCHPGNILLRPHPQRPSEPQCVLIDHGLSYPIPPAEKRILCDLWVGATTRDTPLLQSVMAELGYAKTAEEVTAKQVDTLASAFLQTLYSAFHVHKVHVSEFEMEEMRKGAMDPELNRTLAKLPTAYLLVLSTISQYRAVHKILMLGEHHPVSRTQRMLRIAIMNGSERVATSWMGVRMALFKLWMHEVVNWVALSLAVWWDPKLKEVVPDELLQLG